MAPTAPDCPLESLLLAASAAMQRRVGQSCAAWRSVILPGVVWLGLMAGHAAHAQTAPSATDRDAEQRFASVLRMRGEVSATTTDGSRVRVLREGDRVFVGERVSASAASEAVLRTEDAGLLAVRPGGVFVAERFAAEGKPTDNLSLRLFMGSIRMVTGWIGHTNRAGYRVLTPSATIGIRGTDHEPFVLTPELAGSLGQTEGTYDKVNRGGTTLDANGSQVDIPPGRVGFVRANRSANTRSLLTLLLPVLLDRVPGFFVPGEFDAELDQLSLRNDAESLRLLEELRRTGGTPGAGASGGTTGPATSATIVASATLGGAAAAPASTATALATAAPAEPLREGTNSCGANAVARAWLAEFDRAIVRRNAAGVLRLFAANAEVQATVRTQDGRSSTLSVDRETFVESTVAAIAGLREYRQRRVSTDGWPETPGDCRRIGLRSVVIEQGRQNGQPYRFEATETYVLERQAGRWVAVQARAAQR